MEDEARLQMDLALEHLAAMKEAAALFRSVAEDLDEARQATLVVAVTILSDVGMCAPDWIAAVMSQLRAFRRRRFSAE